MRPTFPLGGNGSAGAATWLRLITLVQPGLMVLLRMIAFFACQCRQVKEKPSWRLLAGKLGLYMLLPTAAEETCSCGHLRSIASMYSCAQANRALKSLLGTSMWLTCTCCLVKLTDPAAAAAATVVPSALPSPAVSRCCISSAIRHTGAMLLAPWAQPHSAMCKHCSGSQGRGLLIAAVDRMSLHRLIALPCVVLCSL